MRHPPDLYRTAVDAYRELTAAGDAADATRARVLAAAARTTQPRRIPLAVGLGAALMALTSASLAATALARHWRQPPAQIIAWMPSADPSLLGKIRRVTAALPLPPAEPERARSPDRPDAEAELYGRAHQLHFAGRAPERALAAWDTYLARFPRGTFAPEARYNRALCLIRLGRFSQAEAALRPFSDGRLAGYRQDEAARLLDWLHARPAPP